MFGEKVYPGIHPSADTNIKCDFSESEGKIIKQWASQWYITSAGKRALNNSEYKFALVKPTDNIEEALNISREIVIIFSPYDSFEARTLDSYNALTSELTDQRYERICYVLISADENIEETLKHYLSNQESQIIIPFSYKEFQANRSDQFFIRNKFRRHFYSRDLFDYSEPLKKDLYFFGRNEIVTQIIAKHHNGLNSGYFGLRKTGKTSIIYDVDRKSFDNNFLSIIIDCQDTSFNMRRWNFALFYVCDCIAKKLNFKEKIEEASFTVQDASVKFKYYLEKFHKMANKKILLMFDEIENITFGKSSSKHWCEDLDFVHFWQSIRSIYQSSENIFTFCIFGTNAKCIEDSSILGKDNPIYNMFQPCYIPGFDHDQTREMVRKLGRIMGMRFDESIYTHLIEDYGGHPFLIRRVCSKISKLNPERPVTIDRVKYLTSKEQFNSENIYFQMILDVLQQFYAEEYEMLKFLAIDDNETFNYFVREDRSMVNHLIGYGLIRENDGRYDFKIDAIKDYILRKEAKHIELTTPEEKWSHLCVLRNSLETELRKMVKSIIRFAHKTESEAKDYVVRKVFSNDRKFSAKTYQQLFDSRSSNIYLKNLTDLINADWDYFSDYFGKQEVFISHMNLLNSEGRFDAHATVPEGAEIHAIDNATSYVKKAIDKYYDSLN